MVRSVAPASLILSIALLAAPTFAGSFDHLTELTGKLNAIVTLKGRDNFTSEYRYDVSVRNHSPDVIVADSLIILLDKITNLAGDDREGLTGESFLKRFEVLGQDGETEEGKPFFRIPAGSAHDLGPQTDSMPASVRIRNRDYVAVFTPTFRIFGLKRMPQEPSKRVDETVSPAHPGGPATTNRETVEKLIQLLIKKGVLTQEEWRKANQP
jgi:hypothetical protein